MNPNRLAPIAAALALLATCPARAAQSYDSCTGTISSLPAVIATQGVWCMKQDLSTAMVTGTAITVNANNVTIDCNGFKLGGLAAGPSSVTNGIKSEERANTTIRNCNVRGFNAGILVTSTAGGHLIENNRIDGSLTAGIGIAGDGSIVRNNLVFSTGGSTLSAQTYALSTYGSIQILDNTISDVFGSTTQNGNAHGIYYSGAMGGIIARNHLSGIAGGGSGEDNGIVVGGSLGVILRDNDISGEDTLKGTGIYCDINSAAITGNIVLRMADPWLNCLDLGQNGSD